MFRRFIGFAVVLLAPAAYAQIAETARGIGMGGALRGDPVGNSAIIANPAGMARSYLYAAQGQYVRNGAKLNAAGASIVDSKTKPALATGLAYHYQFSGEEGVTNDGHDVRLAFAHPFKPQVFHVGIGMRYLHLDRKVADVSSELREFTLDAGMLFSPTPAVHLGLVGHNLIKTDDPAAPRQAGGGIAFTGHHVTLDFDGVADFDSHPDGVKPVLAAGAELVLGQVIPVRGGYTYNGVTEQNFVSGGLGFIDTTRSKEGNQLNVSYRQNVDNTDDWLLSATVVLFM